MLTLEEFIKTTYHTRTFIILPTLSRMKIEKSKFVDKNGKYNIQRQNEYLEKLYNRVYGK